jgi:hypothetical protein
MKTGSENAKLWASLDGLLPTLAEAEPNEFLKALEACLVTNPSPFEELFAQEGNGVFGRNYLTGVYWSLENLAWRSEFLVRCCVLLAGLAKIDPGGQWANRPLNSLTTILLPWFPQTKAPFETRFAAVKTIRREYPDVAWDLLKSLLPSGHGMTSGSSKPKWIKLTVEELKPKVSVEEYWNEVGEYAKLAFEMAKEDPKYLPLLASEADHLPVDVQEDLVEFLTSSKVLVVSLELKRSIWENLLNVTTRHRRYSETDWALPSERVNRLEEAVSALAPASPQLLYRRLFSNDEFDLYEESDDEDWDAQREKLQNMRNQAIKEIESASGVKGVLAFSEDVDSPYRVGVSLGLMAEPDADRQLLQSNSLALEDGQSDVVYGFITGRFSLHGWKWVDALDRSEWSASKKLLVLKSLPFKRDTWVRVNEWLGAGAKEYWQSINPNTHQTDDLLKAADCFLEAGRPYRAIDCLYIRKYRKDPLDVSRAVSALIAGIRSEEPTNQHQQYHLTELISALQKDDSIAQEDLVRIEWAYLRLLDRPGRSRPVTLFKKLSSDPPFFCEIIRMIYRSKNAERDFEPELSEDQKAMASNAWRLLHAWSRVPGESDDGTFSESGFEAWLSAVIAECTETGHLEVALSEVGKVCFHSPEEADRSLWISRAVARELNRPEAEAMRRGYTSAAFNSRGVHSVDPSGLAELKIAEDWKTKALAVENEGFHRFAAELREHVEHYVRESERIKMMYGNEKDSEIDD